MKAYKTSNNVSYCRPAKSPDLCRRLPAFSLLCRLSDFHVKIFSEIEKLSVIFYFRAEYFNIKGNRLSSFISVWAETTSISTWRNQTITCLTHAILRLLLGGNVDNYRIRNKLYLVFYSFLISADKTSKKRKKSWPTIVGSEPLFCEGSLKMKRQEVWLFQWVSKTYVLIDS